MHPYRISMRLAPFAALLLAACTAAGRTDRPETGAAEPTAAQQSSTQPSAVAAAGGADRIFEMRTYTAPDGKLGELNARFRNHTTRLFARHGMTNVGYWIPTDSVLSKNTIIYILAYPSRDAARASWTAFSRDPEWQRVRRESEANGPIVARVQSVFMTPTEYSAIR